MGKEAVVSKKKKRQSATAPVITAPPRPEHRDLLLIFAGALALRLIGLPWGLPNAEHFYSYHPDEIFLLLPSFGFLRGDWNPHFFNYGTFYIYLVGLATKAVAALGLFSLNSPDMGLLYSLGRLLTALLGAGTVALTYLIGEQLGGRRLAIGAAALLALAPLHLVNSHFATVDVPGTFFLVLGIYACLRIIYQGDLKWYLLAGAAMGLASATKYNFGAGALLVIFAHLLRGKVPARQHLALLYSALFFPLFFLIGCPYFLDLAGGLHIRKEFLDGFLFEAQHMRSMRTVSFVNTGPGWSYHLLRGFPAALGIPLYLLSVMGLAWALACRKSKEWRGLLLLAAWVVGYFVMISFATERFIRYLAPLVPALCIFAAWLIVRLLSLPLSLRKPALVGAGVLLTLNVAYSLAQLALFVTPDPRDRALAAILTMKPQKIGIQESPWFRAAPVAPFNGGAFSEASFKEWQATSPYRVVVTDWQKDILLKEAPPVFTIGDLKYEDYLRLQAPEAKEFMRTLESSYRNEQLFRHALPLEWVGGGRANVPPDWLYLKPAVSVYSGWQHD